MVAHGGVTYTLSDYWELGPPFPWELHLSFEPFGGGGGGGNALGIPLFSISCFLQFPKVIFQSSNLLLHFSDLTPHRWFGFSFIHMGRLFHLFPGIRVNPAVLLNFAVSL